MRPRKSWSLYDRRYRRIDAQELGREELVPVWPTVQTRGCAGVGQGGVGHSRIVGLGACGSRQECVNCCVASSLTKSKIASIFIWLYQLYTVEQIIIYRWRIIYGWNRVGMPIYCFDARTRLYLLEKCARFSMNYITNLTQKNIFNINILIALFTNKLLNKCGCRHIFHFVPRFTVT